MSSTSPQMAAPTSQHLIVESISTESLANSVLPSLKVQGVTVAGARHIQVMRYVYTIVEAQDLYFEGRRLTQMPGIREAITEWLRPGQQIVSRPTGRFSVLHAYTGKKNVGVAHIGQRAVFSAEMRFIGLFGSDPASARILYGNPAVPFVQRGEAPSVAAAYYNSATRRFQVIETVRREALLQDFLRRFSPNLAQTG